ncbi:MAG: dipicolinate synthase subunit DpsA [Ruminococcus sp.]|jgi:dipicolinate synthase subunit A|nr:dipicolinate synthase subunit DpsA [Ruminococcus sp.]
MSVFLVAGGDLRYTKLSESLAQKHTVFAAGFDKNAYNAEKSRLLNSLSALPERLDYIILPIPASIDGVHVNAPFSSKQLTVSELIPFIKPGGTVFAARLSPSLQEKFSDAGLTVIDYSQREDFAVMNAVATSEGAIQIAMENTLTTLSDRNILILGMGRIAKVLIRHLLGFTKNITAAARKSADIAWAEIYCGNGIHIDELLHSDKIKEYDLIFNTIPALILDEKALSAVNRDALIIDLASRPGGVDFEAAKRLGIQTEWALSLPGKVAPITGGDVIAKTILNIISES